MIYLINQGVRQAAGCSRGCVGVGVGVEVAKLAALPSQQQSVGEVVPQSSNNSGGYCKVWRASKSEVGGCCFVEPPSTSSGCDDQTRQTNPAAASGAASSRDK